MQPETGGRWTGETLEHLIGIVLEHRQWKGLAKATKEEVKTDVEAQICSGMPPGLCRPDPGEDYQPIVDRARDISVESIMEFSATAFRFIKSGVELVDKEESERRAAICRGCRFNRPSPCVVCTPAFKMVDALIPKDRMEPGLSACGVCGCSLRAKVLLPLGTIRADDASSNLRFPNHCWLSNGQA